MMVVAANPQAAQAGLAILKAGGTAMDAAVAVQAVLGLVEPHASGLGGGAMLLYYEAASRTVTSYDGRETAPAAVKPDLFLGPDGKPVPFTQAVLGGRPVGVPGAVPMLQIAYKAHGKLPWADLFKPAIKLAEDGFPVAPRLARLIATEATTLGRQPALRDYFLQSGPPKAGALLKNPAYADTLRHLAADGAAALQTGPIAADIAAAIRSDPVPGLMTADDLAAYKPMKRDPVCAAYRTYTICSAAPPSSGGISVLETLGVLSPFRRAGIVARLRRRLHAHPRSRAPRHGRPRRLRGRSCLRAGPLPRAWSQATISPTGPRRSTATRRLPSPAQAIRPGTPFRPTQHPGRSHRHHSPRSRNTAPATSPSWTRRATRFP